MKEYSDIMKKERGYGLLVNEMKDVEKEADRDDAVKK
jgi:hypothetical protein